MRAIDLRRALVQREQAVRQAAEDVDVTVRLEDLKRARCPNGAAHHIGQPIAQALADRPPEQAMHAGVGRAALVRQQSQIVQSLDGGGVDAERLDGHVIGWQQRGDMRSRALRLVDLGIDGAPQRTGAVDAIVAQQLREGLVRGAPPTDHGVEEQRAAADEAGDVRVTDRALHLGNCQRLQLYRLLHPRHVRPAIAAHGRDEDELAVLGPRGRKQAPQLPGVAIGVVKHDDPGLLGPVEARERAAGVVVTLGVLDVVGPQVLHRALGQRERWPARPSSLTR